MRRRGFKRDLAIFTATRVNKTQAYYLYVHMRMPFPVQKFCASAQFIESDQPDEESYRCAAKNQFIIINAFEIFGKKIKKMCGSNKIQAARMRSETQCFIFFTQKRFGIGGFFTH